MDGAGVGGGNGVVFAHIVNKADIEATSYLITFLSRRY